MEPQFDVEECLQSLAVDCMRESADMYGSTHSIVHVCSDTWPRNKTQLSFISERRGRVDGSFRTNTNTVSPPEPGPALLAHTSAVTHRTTIKQRGREREADQGLLEN